MKKTILSLLSLLAMACMGHAQSFYSGNQQLIKDAIIGAFCIVDQAYQLQDTTDNRLYGRNNQPEFGSMRRLGVRTQQGVVVSEQMTHPWDYDQECERYLGKFRGVASNAYVYSVDDSVRIEEVCIVNPDLRTNSELLLYADTVQTYCPGFQLYSAAGQPLKGWVVWVTSNADIAAADSTTSVSYQIFKKEIDLLSIDSMSMPIDKPNTQNKVWGGAYLVPEITAMGQITFKLAGIMVEKDGQWVIALPYWAPANATIEEAVVEEEAVVADEAPMLTPIDEPEQPAQPVNDKKKKDKKKSNK